MKKLIKILIPIVIVASIFGITSHLEKQIPDEYPVFNEQGITFDPSAQEDNYINKLYYRQLSDSQKLYYQCLYNASAKYDTYFNINFEYDIDEFVEVSKVFGLDFPEYYWWDNCTFYDESIYNFMGVEFKYVKVVSNDYTKLSIESAKEQIDLKVNEIIDEVKAEDDIDTIKNLHDYLINKTTYIEDSYYNQNLRGALFYDETVCAGYSELFQYIANRLGYECYSIVGETLPKTSENSLHEWNTIKVNDIWYWIDITWDEAYDEDGNEIGPRYEYFLASDDVFIIDHIPDVKYNYPICDDLDLYGHVYPIKFIEELNYKEIDKIELSWLKQGHKEFEFKVKDFDDIEALENHIFDNFVTLYRNNIDAYSGLSYTIYHDEDSHDIKFEFSKF